MADKMGTPPSRLGALHSRAIVPSRASKAALTVNAPIAAVVATRERNSGRDARERGKNRRHIRANACAEKPPRATRLHAA